MLNPNFDRKRFTKPHRKPRLALLVPLLLAFLTHAPAAPARADTITLPKNGAQIGDVIDISGLWWGQDNYDGSGRVVMSNKQRSSGPITIYVYTGNSPQSWLWGEVPTNPAIVPVNTIQQKCNATLATSVATYYNGYGDGDWQALFPSIVEMDGNEVLYTRIPDGSTSTSANSMAANVYTQSSRNLAAWTVYVINLTCPPLP